jgi:HEAT repeat protein
MIKMSRFALVAFAISMSFCAWGAALGQEAKEYEAAKTDLERQIKSSDRVARQKAIKRLRATNDQRAAKDLRSLIHRTNKVLDQNEKKLHPLLTEKAEVTGELDKRIGTKKTVAMGLVEPLLKNLEELTAKIDPLEAATRLELDTKTALLVGLGDLITSLEPQVGEAETDEIISLFERIKKEEDRRVYLEIMSYIRTPKSVAALVGFALGEANKDMRILALNALGRLADPAGAAAALKSLDDDYWVVRSAAIQTIGALGLLDGVPLLIERLEKEDGRLKDDIQDVLRNLAGVTFHDNVTLWREWWKANEAKLREIYAAASDGDAARRDDGLRRAAEAGFLLGIRAWLDGRGLSLAAIRDQEARRTQKAEDELPPEKDLFARAETPKDEDTALYQVIGTALSTRAPAIAKSAIDRLFVAPFNRSEDVDKKLALLHILWHVDHADLNPYFTNLVISLRDRATEPEKAQAQGPAQKLAPRVKDEPDTAARATLRAALRIAAVRGLGRHPDEKPVDFSDEKDSGRKTSSEILAGLWHAKDAKDEARVEVQAAAARALGDIGTQAAIGKLLRGLDDMANRPAKEAAAYAAAKDAILLELKKLTKQDLGEKPAPWQEWWAANKRSFRTDKERAVAKTESEEGKKAERGTSFYGIQTSSKRLCYVLDISGSMNEPAAYGGVNYTKMKVAKDEAVRSITALPDDALFNVILFSTTFKPWKKALVQATPAMKKEAKDMIEAIDATGATNIYDSVAKAFELAGRGSFDKGYAVALDTIYLMSDGAPNQGLYTDPRDIIRHIVDLNATKKVQIHTIGVGKDHNEALMRELATLTGGQYVAK